jgi:microcystin degradation protein MlrC
MVPSPLRPILATLLVAALGACGTPPDSTAPDNGAGARADGARGLVTVEPVRIAVLRFQHETCTFCPGGDVTIDDWTRIRPPDTGEAVLTAGGYVRGFTAAAREYPGVELVGLTSPPGVYGGSSRSWSTKDTFEHFMGTMIDELKAAMPVDGVYLALHGAMAVRDLPRPEAEIAKRVREVVGPDVPIVGSFDLHGNEDEEFLRWANASFVTKRYPHYDTTVQGARSARLLLRMIRGTYDSTTATRKPGVITPTVLQWTGKPPAMDIMERARRWESREEDVFVSVLFGFPWSDVPDVGATVQVMTNGDQALADRIADDMNEYIWRTREAMFDQPLVMPEEAVARAHADLEAGREPVVLADYSDRNGDSTWILDEVIEQGLPGVLYGTIRDEHVIDALTTAEAEAGMPFDMPVGGFAADSSGEPVRVQGTLRYFGEGMGYDKMAIVDFGEGSSLMITPALRQVIWLEQLEVADIDPDDYRVFVTKSRVHFRRGFDETGYAKAIHIVDAPGAFVGTTRLEDLPYEHVTLTDYYPYGLPPERR